MTMNQSEAAVGGSITGDVTPNEGAHVVCHVSEPIVSILNAYGKRHTQELAIYGGLYAMGCALASMGADLQPGVDLRKQLSALLDGYEAMLPSLVH